MATSNYVFDELDDHEEYLVVLAKEAKEALLDRKVKEMQKKNRDILKRHAEVEADRKAAEDSGCAVSVKSNQQSPPDAKCEMQSEVTKHAEGDVAKRRGQGQGWGRGRPRASRFRPGHYGQGSVRDRVATESDLFEDKDCEKRLSPSYAGNEKHLPSGDWDTGPPPSSHSSASHPHETQSRPPNFGQKSRESSRGGQRGMPGRGHSRGPFAKFVTVPDASHSHDVRHVEEVNNSIVINIDRSTRPGGDSTRRGGGGGGRSTGGGSGYSAESNPIGEPLEESTNVRDQELGDSTQHQKSGYQGQTRRPFRGRGDGSFRGRGESSFRGQGQGRGDKFRRGRGDGPRPFRGGYRSDRPRGDRTTSRRAVIVTSKSERGDDSQQVPEPEDWDKSVPADVAVEAGAIDGHGWTNTEDGSANWDEGEGNHDPGKSEVIEEKGQSCKELHKELDLHKGDDVAHQDQPVELEHHTVKQSENHLGGIGDQPKADLINRDKSISTRAEHSPSCMKPCETLSVLPAAATKGGLATEKPRETLSALPVEPTKGDLGTHAVEKLTEKPSETLSALPVQSAKSDLGTHAVEKLTGKPSETLSALPVQSAKSNLGTHAVEKLTGKPSETLSALPVEPTKSDLGTHAVEKLTEKPSETLSALPVQSAKSNLGTHAVEKLTGKPSETLSALPVEPTKSDLGTHAVEKLTEKPSETLSALPVQSAKSNLGTHAVEKLTEKPSETLSALPVQSAKSNLGTHAMEKLTEKPSETLFALPVESAKSNLGTHAVEKLTEKPSETLSALPVESAKSDLGTHAVEKFTEKPSETFSALPVESAKSNLGTHAVEKLTEKPSETLSALPVESAKSDLGTHAVEKLTEKPSETLSALEVAGLVDLSSSKTDSLALVSEKAVSTNSKGCEISSSTPVPSMSTAAAAGATETSLQPEAIAGVLIGESISADFRSPDSCLVEKSEAVRSEIPASVKENT